MSREFEIRREVELPGSPEQVFEAVTSGTEAWLFPSAALVNPRAGATTADGSTILAWDPPRHFHQRTDGADGWFNALEFLIEGREGGSAVLRYVHSGIIADDWDDQYDGIDAHTDFYLHTLGQYLAHFAGRPVTYVGGEGSGGVMGPASSTQPGSLAKLRTALGLDGAAVGDTVRLRIPGLLDDHAVVDYLSDRFVGLRTSTTLVRIFGRDAWGMPVAASAHVFGDSDVSSADVSSADVSSVDVSGVDAASGEKAIQSWLEEIFS